MSTVTAEREIEKLFLNSYKIKKLLSANGRNTVHKASSHGIKTVILKTLCLDNKFRTIKHENKVVSKEYFFLRLLMEEKVTPRLIDYLHTRQRGYVVMELLPPEWRTLLTYINTNETDDTSIRTILSNIVEILLRLKRLGVYYINLKPDNIMVHQSSLEIRLIDFEDAIYDQSIFPQMNNYFGTPAFYSPEMCFNGSCSVQKSQIFTLGCLIFSCFEKRTPFPSFEEALKVTYTMSYSLDPGVRTLIHKCLKLKPSRRTSLKAVLGYLRNEKPKKRRLFFSCFSSQE